MNNEQKTVKKRRPKKSIVYIAMALAGIVIGEVFSALVKGVPALAWLAYRVNFGLTTPLTIDLALIKLTLGGYLVLNPSVILFTAGALVGAYYLTKKR